MLDASNLLLSLLAVPAVAAALISLAPARVARPLALLAALTTLGLGVALAGLPGSSAASPELTFRAPWIPSLGVEFFLGVDGLSLPFVVLTVCLFVLAVLASARGVPRESWYYALLMLLEAGVLGVFLALDLVLLFLCWELTLLPMVLLIGVWGGHDRLRAAVKYFFFTLCSGVCLLTAIVLLHVYSDPAGSGTAAAAGVGTGRTFDLIELAAIGQQTGCFSAPLALGRSVQWWAFAVLLVAFAIKLPAVPVHTWLPAAHVEAPTAVSMLLAGVMLKLGGYGLLRISFPLCPQGALEWAPTLAVLGAVGIVWGSLAALAQREIKRLVAYSSVAHMGYVLLGLGAGASSYASFGDAGAWRTAAAGAVFQMIAHGVTSAGMFFVVGMLYERVGHRDLDRFGGVLGLLPGTSALGIALLLAGMGLPGMCGFVGELLVLLGAWPERPLLVAVAAGATVLAAGYTLWAIQRVYLGAEYHGPNAAGLRPARPAELLVAGSLLAAAVALGVYPNPLLRVMRPAVAVAIDAAACAESTPKLSALAAPERSRGGR